MQFKYVVGITGGKGGVGKSTTSVNLAVALAMQGKKVGLLDADIYGPNIPRMMGIEKEEPQIVGQKVMPFSAYGVSVMSMGSLMQDGQALMWRGSMVMKAIEQLLRDILWEELDVLVIDMPPGTGDIQLTLAQSYNVKGTVLVTTPQKLATADVRRAAMMYRQDKLTIPLLGVVENMSYFTPDELPDKKFYIFGKGATDELARELEIPVLGRLPIKEKIVESGDGGIPVVLNNDNGLSNNFAEIAVNVEKEIEKL